MNRILAIDTSSEACSVALQVDGTCIEKYQLSPRGHADLVLPWVKELMADAETSLDSLDAIAFNRGPGSFTSLRIGISVVQGLAWGAGLPVVPVSSLQTVAEAAALQGADRVIVAMDARMGEIYTARYEREGPGLKLLGDEKVCPPEEILSWFDTDWVGAGNGFSRFPELEQAASKLHSTDAEIWPRASLVAAQAERWLQNNEGLPAEQAQPVYIRDKVAQKTAEREGKATKS